MTNTSFDDFIKQRSEVSKKAEIDWQAECDKWKKHLSEFHDKVEGFLKPYTDSHKLKVTRKKVDLHEEYIGSYKADALDILLGNTKITLKPIGTNIIGAKGRVDMIGPRGIVRFVLVSRDSNGPKISVQIGKQSKEVSSEEKIEPILEWKISTSSPRISYMELVEESFQTALMEVVNG